MALSTPQIECLLMALLSVNKFSLEKAWSLLPRLREAGLTDPARVAAMDVPTTTHALVRAGYDRRSLTRLFAERVQALMNAIHTGKLASLAAAIATKDKRQVSALLAEVHGVGPVVIESAWALLMN